MPSQPALNVLRMMTVMWHTFLGAAIMPSSTALLEASMELATDTTVGLSLSSFMDPFHALTPFYSALLLNCVALP